jgi:hypothetical protein
LKEKKNRDNVVFFQSQSHTFDLKLRSLFENKHTGKMSRLEMFTWLAKKNWLDTPDIWLWTHSNGSGWTDLSPKPSANLYQFWSPKNDIFVVNFYFWKVVLLHKTRFISITNHSFNCCELKTINFTLFGGTKEIWTLITWFFFQNVNVGNYKFRGLSETQEMGAWNDAPAISPPDFLVNANYQEPDATQNEHLCMAIIEPKPRPPPLMPERDSVLLSLNQKRKDLAKKNMREKDTKAQRPRLTT